MLRLSRALAPIVIAVLLVAQHPNPAAGDHGGRAIGSLLNCNEPGRVPPRCTSVGNTLRHFVYFDSTFTDGLASSLRDTMAEDYDPTALAMYEQTEITAYTDVIAFSEDYGDIGAAGWVYCPSDAPQGINSHGDRWCQQQELRFNLNPRYAVFFADDASRDHVTCHELGHTLGLRHWGNPPDSAGPAAATCMHANTPDGPVDLHQIDIDHINAYYAAPTVAPRPGRRPVIVQRPAGQSREVASTWSGAVVETVELEHYGSLSEMTRSSYVVVRGRVIEVVPGRVFGESSHALHYAAAKVRVEEVLAGGLPPQDFAELTLEIPLFDGPASIATMQSALPSVESILFLRNKGESARAAGLSPEVQLIEGGFYRLVVFGAVVINESGDAAVARGEGAGFLDQLSGKPFDEVIRLVRDAAP